MIKAELPSAILSSPLAQKMATAHPELTKIGMVMVR